MWVIHNIEKLKNFNTIEYSDKGSQLLFDSQGLIISTVIVLKQFSF